MTYVIASGCIDVKDRACVKCCPVDCIYEGGRTLYIHPDECISCGICVSVCPTEAIHDAQELPPHEAVFAAINRSSSGRTSAAWARLAARTACSPRPATIRWSRPIRRARVASVLSRSVVRAYPRDGTLGPMLVPARRDRGQNPGLQPEDSPCTPAS